MTECHLLARAALHCTAQHSTSLHCTVVRTALLHASTTRQKPYHVQTSDLGQQPMPLHCHLVGFAGNPTAAPITPSPPTPRIHLSCGLVCSTATSACTNCLPNSACSCWSDTSCLTAPLRQTRTSLGFARAPDSVGMQRLLQSRADTLPAEHHKDISQANTTCHKSH